ncbi:MAG: hypothetical protein LEGION0403_FIIPPAGN_01210 [Legionella sp.]
MLGVLLYNTVHNIDRQSTFVGYRDKLRLLLFCERFLLFFSNPDLNVFSEDYINIMK